MTADTPTVVVVEDERHLADLFASWLEDEFDVRTAYDGEEATRAIDGDVDVVLLDRRMPGRSGDEVLEDVEAGGYDCKVAMVTAVEPDFDVLGMGFDDYLLKPVSYDDLHETVDRLLARRSYDDQLDEYARLLSKKVALETEKSRHELEVNDEFAALESKVDRLGQDVDEMVQDFDEADFAAALRDLPAGRGC